MGATNVPYSLPPSHLLKPIIVCGVVMALSASRSVIAPGSLLYDNLLHRSPTAITAAAWIQNGLFYFFYGAHSIESVMMMKKLVDQGVSAFSGTFWKWVVECFIGGKFCFDHFEDVIKGKKVL